MLVSTFGALEPQHDLLCGFGLLSKYGLGLTTKARLFAIVTPLTLSKKTSLAGLVLRNFVKGVLHAFSASAVGILCLRNVNHCGRRTRPRNSRGMGIRKQP
jgi:hypothetical protein